MHSLADQSFRCSHTQRVDEEEESDQKVDI